MSKPQKMLSGRESPVPNAPMTLEERIAASLANAAAGSAEIEELIAETEAAIAAAVLETTALREQATDLVAAPDAKAAFDAAELARLGRDRLRAALPKLQDHLGHALAAEQRAQWQHEYEDMLSGYDPLAEKLDDLDERLGRLEAERIKLNRRAMDYNDLADAINRRAEEMREERRLPTLELSMPAGRPDGADRKWGPPKVDGGLALAVVRSMALPYCPGPHWSDPEVQEQRRAEIEKQQAHIAKYHERASEAQEERQKAEERDRFNVKGSR